MIKAQLKPNFDPTFPLSLKEKSLQEVAQLAETMTNEAEVTSLNLLPPFCVDLSKKKKKKSLKEKLHMEEREP
jgi:hypothetical protein